MPRLPPKPVTQQSISTVLAQLKDVKNQDANLRIKQVKGKTSIRSDSAKGAFKGFSIRPHKLVEKTLQQQNDLVNFIRQACQDIDLPERLNTGAITAKEGIALLSTVMDKLHENERQTTVINTIKDAVDGSGNEAFVKQVVSQENDLDFLELLHKEIETHDRYGNGYSSIVTMRIDDLKAGSSTSVDGAASTHSPSGNGAERVSEPDKFKLSNANETNRQAAVTKNIIRLVEKQNREPDVQKVIGQESDIDFLEQLYDTCLNEQIYDNYSDMVAHRIQLLTADSSAPSPETTLTNTELARDIFSALGEVSKNIASKQKTLSVLPKGERYQKFRYPKDSKISKIPEHTAISLPTSGNESPKRFHGNFIQLHPDEPLTIATQSPLLAAQGDFWLASFSNDSKVIVDLTQDIDMDNNKASVYYPEEIDASLTFKSGGEILTVSLCSQDVHPDNPDIISSKYSVVDAQGNEKEISRVHFKGWVDRSGIEADVLNEVIDTVDEIAGRDGVVTVHCSAGVGRTGTLATARTAKHQLAGETMDASQIKEEILKMGTAGREQRNLVFIQRDSQMLTLVNFFQNLGNLDPEDPPKVKESDDQNVDQATPPPSARSLSVAHFWRNYDSLPLELEPEKVWEKVVSDMGKVSPNNHAEILDEFENMQPGTKNYVLSLLNGQ
ncbi:MAG: dual specificity protein phosphatase family protein [Endozoicomonadaceae bacterium]|nr:dual specificity protein phosphatase family protein [Endozoicomonadaceae bacterium]